MCVCARVESNYGESNAVCVCVLRLNTFVSEVSPLVKLDLKGREKDVEILRLQNQVSGQEKRGGQGACGGQAGDTWRVVPSASSQGTLLSEGAEYQTRDVRLPPCTCKFR